KVTGTPAIQNQPTDMIVAVGGTATFIATSNPAADVKWQLKFARAKDFTDINGASSTTLTIADMVLARDGSMYRAVFTNASGTATSRSALLHIEPLPQIVLQPADVAAQAGQSATFTALANGPPSKVQWEISTDGGQTFIKIAGATKTTLRLKTLAEMNGAQFRA